MKKLVSTTIWAGAGTGGLLALNNNNRQRDRNNDNDQDTQTGQPTTADSSQTFQPSNTSTAFNNRDYLDFQIPEMQIPMPSDPYPAYSPGGNASNQGTQPNASSSNSNYGMRWNPKTGSIELSFNPAEKLVQLLSKASKVGSTIASNIDDPIGDLTAKLPGGNVINSMPLYQPGNQMGMLKRMLNEVSETYQNTAQVGQNSIDASHSWVNTVYQMAAYAPAESTGVTDATYCYDNTDPLTGKRAGKAETWGRSIYGGVKLVLNVFGVKANLPVKFGGQGLFRSIIPSSRSIVSQTDEVAKIVPKKLPRPEAKIVPRKIPRPGAKTSSAEKLANDVAKARNNSYNNGPRTSRPVVPSRPFVSSGPQGAIYDSAKPLTSRQRSLLSQLSEQGTEAVVRKRGVSMNDLRNLTLHTGDEFAMLTRKGERLIIRGGVVDDIPGIPSLNVGRAQALSADGWRFSGHTHIPGFQAVGSAGDKAVLQAFGQRQSAVWGTEWGESPGRFFGKFSDEIDFNMGLFE